MLNLSTCLSCVHHFVTFLPTSAASSSCVMHPKEVHAKPVKLSILYYHFVTFLPTSTASSSCVMHPKEVHAKPVNLSILYSSLCDRFSMLNLSTCLSCIRHFVTFLPPSAASSCAMHEENIEKHVPNSCILFCFVLNFMALLPLGPASSYAVHLEEH